MHRLARTPFPALHKTAADRLPALVDKGHIGAGIGILVPVRRPKDIPSRTCTRTRAPRTT